MVNFFILSFLSLPAVLTFTPQKKTMLIIFDESIYFLSKPFIYIFLNITQ